MNQQILDMQAQTIEQTKAVQSQVLEMNTRVAEAVMGVMPEMPTPFADSMPNPADMMTNYFDFVGELRDANREFAQAWISAWMPAEKAAKRTKATKTTKK